MAYTAFSGDTTRGTQLDVFIPELWADGVYRYFEKQLVFKPFFDDYSSLVKEPGIPYTYPQYKKWLLLIKQ